MSLDSQRHYSVDDYFKVEEMSEVKHEFYSGEIFAMAGASLRHNEIAANVLAELRVQLRNSDYGAYGSDLRVQTPNGLYTYPDISVICGRAEVVSDRPDTVMNPIVLLEVLSQATEDYDRGEKFSLYKSIPALSHYVLISQTAFSSNISSERVRANGRFVLLKISMRVSNFEIWAFPSPLKTFIAASFRNS